MLFLKKHLANLVRQGKKTQTIRLWRRPMVRPGQRAFVPGLGRVRIVSVDAIASLAVLTRADARADGFASLAAFRQAFEAIYGKTIPRGKSLYRVRFAYPAEDATKRSCHAPAAKEIAEDQTTEARRQTLAAFLRAATDHAASAAAMRRRRSAAGKAPRTAARKS